MQTLQFPKEWQIRDICHTQVESTVYAWFPTCPVGVSSVIASQEIQDVVRARLKESGLDFVFGVPPVDSVFKFMVSEAGLGYDPPRTVRFDPVCPHSAALSESVVFDGSEVLALRGLRPGHLWYVCLMRSRSPDWRVTGLSGQSGVRFDKLVDDRYPG